MSAVAVRLIRFLAGVLALFAAAVAHGGPPNVVVILTDDQGWGDFSLHGNTQLETPHIDRLAHGGARFDAFYVSPVCSPTRAEFLTGRHHVRTGVYSTSEGGERLNADETTIADHFQRAGYRTGAFGKWHNGTQHPYHPNARGFDAFYGFCSGHWGDYFSPMLDHNNRLVTGNGYVVDDFTERAIAFIEQDPEQPFFVYLPYNTPHSPMQVPDRWWDRHSGQPLDLPHRYRDKEADDHTRAALAMCENIDWNVGRLLDRLDQLGLAESTIIVYFCDNGPNGWRWNGDLRGKKGSTDEGGVRSPLFIRWPGEIAPGTRVHQLAAATDLLPTLAALAGIDAGAGKPLDGIDLSGFLRGEQVEPVDRMVVSHWGGATSVRDSRFRLDASGRLYDLVEDPGQRVDVAADHPEAANRLRAHVDTWRATMLAGYGPEHDRRPFVVGHPDAVHTQLPARDAAPAGNLRRSNRWPNDSFLTGWTSTGDTITWDCEVGAGGEYAVDLLYTCAPGDVGSRIELSFNDSRLVATVTAPHDPPLQGREHDRFERQESYTKDFKKVRLGRIRLDAGAGALVLRALEIPGSQVMDFRMLYLTRVGEEASSG